MKILDYDDFYYIAQQTDKIFGLIHSWRFLDLEFPERLPTPKALIAEKPFKNDSEIDWLGCFDVSNYMHSQNSYDCRTNWDMRFIYSSDNPLLLFNLLDEYYSDEGLIFSAFQIPTYHTILSIDKSEYDWIAMEDGNEYNKSIVFFDNTSDFDMSIIENRLNGIE